MTAEIVSVGTELLLGQILDTHAPTMARILAECGIGCKYRVTVGDNLDRLVATLKQAIERSDVVVTIGGLGPTSDDLTRDAIALALGDELEVVPEIEERLRALFKARGYTWVESNARQAQKPTSAEIIPNENGTAPGLVCRKNGKTVFALPGPKGEFDPMAFNLVKPMLSTLGGGGVIHSRTLRIIGVGESEVEKRIADLMEQENPTVAPYAHTGEVHLRLTSRAKNQADAEQRIDPVESEIRKRLGRAVYGVNETNLETAVVELLKERRASVATAESVTGGGLGARITSVEGSSAVFPGGVVTYSAVMKHQLLKISMEEIERFTPVSAEVAESMAVRVRETFGATYGVSIVGNAGLTSDVGDKPRGLIYVGIASPSGVQVVESRYGGIREDIRRRAEQNALRLLREEILK